VPGQIRPVEGSSTAEGISAAEGNRRWGCGVGGRMRIELALAVLALGGTLALAGCSDDGGGSGDVVVGPGEGGPRSGLTVTVDPGDGDSVQWSLECGPPGGTHPDPEAACAAIEANLDVLEPLPADVICTEIYGGPETARVEGLWEGERVVVSLSRTNGCEIDRWDRWLPVVVEGGGLKG
jgi:hypothetical protein